MALMRSMMTVGGHTMISRVLGHVRDAVSANILGAGVLSDAVLIAIKIPGLFRRLFAEGAFNSAFVPIFAGELASKGKQQAKVFAEHAVMVMFLLLTAIVLMVEFFTPQFVNFLAPGFLKTPERLQYAIEFTRITFPYIIFISMSAIFGGVLNSMDRFAAPASAQSIGNLLIIFFYVFLAGITQTGGHLAAWGNLGSGIIQFFWLYFFCVHAKIPLKIRMPRLTPQVKEFFKKLLPGMIGAGVAQINLIVDIWLSSTLPEGSVTYINYGERVSQLPLSIIGVAMGIVLLPMLTKQLRQEELDKALFTQNRATEFVLLASVPVAVALMLCSYAFTSLIYGHGKFVDHPGHLIQTSQTLAAFCIGMPAYTLMKVFSSSFFARKDTTTPVVIGLISVGVNFAINWHLMQYYQHVGIAIGTSIASWFNALLLAAFLKKKKMMVLDAQLIRNTPKILISAAIMGMSVYFVQSFLQVHQAGFFLKFGSLLILMAVATVTFIIPAKLMKCLDVKSMMDSKKEE